MLLSHNQLSINAHMRKFTRFRIVELRGAFY